MAYPSTISSFTNPAPTDRLNNPSHSSIETAQNAGLTEIQTFLGTTNTSVLGTLLYDVRSPNSNGGGHVQTANKGGTGQTSYTKGDLLVATSASVLSKLAVGNNNYVLEANSSVAAGVRWIPNNSAPKVAVSGSVLSVAGGAGETPVFAITVPASTLGTNNALRSTIYVSNYDMASGETIAIAVKYGNNTLSTVSPSGSNPPGTSSLMGRIEHVLFAKNSPTSQGGDLMVNMVRNRTNASMQSVLGVNTLTYGTSSVESGANQIYTITVTPGASSVNKMTIDGFIVEKIVS